MPAPVQQQPPTTPPTAAPTTPPLKPGRIRRATGLDGLRGVAVLAVVVYHFFGDVLPGGFLGVDVFFVLSGFLITSLLVREVGATGRINLREFWRRRARRILPAAVTVLLVSTAVAGVIGGDVAVGLVPQFLGSLFSVNNWVQIAQSNSYFAGATPQIFMHYWSLAIEEQFYVLWPVLLLGCLAVSRRLRRNRVGRTGRPFRFAAVVATVLGVASLVAMVVLHDPDADPSRVYFGTDTHAFGILAGVVLALLATSPGAAATDSWPAFSPAGSRRSSAVAWVGGSLALVGLAAMFLLLPDTASLTYQGGLFVASLLTVALIIVVLRGTGPVAALMRWRPLRWFGERSFSLYLWHWPVVVFATALMPDASVPLVGAVSVVVSIALTEASYRWVETPLRRHGYRGTLRALASLRSRTLLPVGAAALAATMLAGVALGQSPAKSELEIELAEIAENTNNTTTQDAAPTQDAPTQSPGLPSGREVTGIGDSVMLASAPALQSRFPGMTVDAETSRHYTGGEGAIAAMASAGTLGEYVVLGFGTNGQAFDGQLDRIVETIGPDHKIILVVPYGHVEGIAPAAQQAIAYAAATPQVYLAPWCQQALAHPEGLLGDGVHPNDAGRSYYADAVEDGLRQAVDGRKDPSVSCAM